MKANQADYAIATQCRVLGVSPSGYYALAGAARPRREHADAALLWRIRAIHARPRGTYGAPRIHAELADEGVHVGRKRVARLMRAGGLGRRQPAQGVRTTMVRDRNARPAPDLVDRDFTASPTNSGWRTSPTSRPWSAFSYLAVVLRRLQPPDRRLGDGDPPARRSSCSTPSTWRSGQRRPDDVDPSFRPGHAVHVASPSGCAARRPACGRRWARSATASTTRCARASSPPSNASCSTGAASRRRPRPAWPSSSSSRAGTTRTGATPVSATCPRSTTNGGQHEGGLIHPATDGLIPKPSTVREPG